MSDLEDHEDHGDEPGDIGIRLKTDIPVWYRKDPREKDKVISKLFELFGAMVRPVLKEYSLPDDYGRYKPDDYVYYKLLDSSASVLKAKRFVDKLLF